MYVCGDFVEESEAWDYQCYSQLLYITPSVYALMKVLFHLECNNSVSDAEFSSCITSLLLHIRFKLYCIVRLCLFIPSLVLSSIRTIPILPHIMGLS
jgi:hypothetical protein